MLNQKLNSKMCQFSRRLLVLVVLFVNFQCSAEINKVFMEFDAWPENAHFVRVKLDHETDSRYYSAPELRIAIDVPEPVTSHIRIISDVLDRFDCIIASSDIVLPSPIWPRQWVQAKIAWRVIAPQKCPIESPDLIPVWENPKLGSSHRLSIFAFDETDVWIVDMNGAAWHYDGKKWKITMQTAGEGLTAAWGASKNDVWVTGANGSIFHWNGTTWSLSHKVQTREYPNISINGIFGFRSTDIYAIGSYGTIIHWDGNRWDIVQSNMPLDLYSIWGSSNQDIWIGGFGGTVLRFDGKQWNSIQIKNKDGTEFKSSIFAIWGTPTIDGSPSPDVWLVGSSGARRRWNGTNWEDMDSEDKFPTWTGISGYRSPYSGRYEVWVAGNGNQLERWKLGTWDPFPPDNYPSMDKVLAIDYNNIWAVGRYGRVFPAYPVFPQPLSEGGVSRWTQSRS